MHHATEAYKAGKSVCRIGAPKEVPLVKLEYPDLTQQGCTFASVSSKIVLGL